MIAEKLSRLRQFAEAMGHWARRNFSGCLWLVSRASLAMIAWIAGVCLAEMLWPGPIGNLLFALVCLLLLELVYRLCLRLLPLLLRRGSGWIPPTAAAAAAMWLVCDQGTDNALWQIALFSIASVLIVQGAAMGVAALLKRRFTPSVILTAVLCIGLTAALGCFLFTDGFDGRYADRYRAAFGPSTSAANPPAFGPHAVSTVDYGTETGLPSDTVSLTRYMDRDSLDALEELQVDLYVDYDLDEIPLIGRIWYPEGGKNCPVLFIAHGNHAVTVDSYLGYGYLGEYLASHGYVVVSVDHNACNMLSGENDGRAVLLLEHIGQVLAYNKAELNGLIDPENISLAGHSRGGEIVATAALFNRYDRYPENGTITFDYNYSIKSLIALAPTVDQYEPGDRSVELEDISYLLLHGASDQDVTNFMGMDQYENIRFTDGSDCIKSALLIADANHGQFNSLWQDEDRMAPGSWLLNTGDFLTMAQQQAIAQTFIHAFLDVTLRGDDSRSALLTDWKAYADRLPSTVYSQCYEQSGFRVLADFEEDSILETGASDGITAKASGVNLWREEQVTYHNNTELDNYGLRLRSGGNMGRYILSIPETDLTGHSIGFDISDYDSDSVSKGTPNLTACAVEITDAAGNTSYIRLEGDVIIYPPLPVRLSKLDYLFGETSYKYSFSTVRLAADRFSGQADLSRIVRITILLEEPGHIRLDNIGIA